jgi:hypothetical protein
MNDARKMTWLKAMDYLSMYICNKIIDWRENVTGSNLYMLFQSSKLELPIIGNERVVWWSKSYKWGVKSTSAP